ncbi:MAG: GerMN domain-containing protein [Moorellaceae bacterium]
MGARGQANKRKWGIGLVLLVLGIALAGYGVKAVAERGEGAAQLPSASPGSEAGKREQSEQPAPAKAKITLYFADRQAMFLVPEEREVVLGKDDTLEAVVIRELIKGPQKEGLARTLPEGTRLLGVKVVEGVAYVDFSREFKTKHWGGSAGESMTLYSVVNSLGKLPGIKKVQFLLEGQKEESILGHADTTEPIAPNWDLVAR